MIPFMLPPAAQRKVSTVTFPPFSRLAPEIAKTVSELIRAPGEPVLVSRDAAVFYEDGAPRRDMVLVELRWRTRPQEMLELAERLRVLLQDAAGCSEVAVSFGQWQPEELYTFHVEESGGLTLIVHLFLICTAPNPAAR